MSSAIITQFKFSHDSGAAFSLDVDLRLPGIGVTAIFGHSGSGKTTLLRCIAGLQEGISPSSKANYVARLQLGETVWQDEKFFLPTHKRSLGYVFQEAGLFPHLTAKQNIDYGVRRAKEKPAQQQYDHVISLMGIEPLLRQFPAQLSGGERQRVAIARALLIRPQLLLMDEPLASLDAARKGEILPYLESLKVELEIPILYVTHSMDEVARLADYLVVLESGRVVAQGPVMDVLSRLDVPALTLDPGVLIEAKVTEKDHQWRLVKAEFDGGELWLGDDTDEKLGQTIRLRVLAKDISLSKTHHTDTSILNRLPVTVLDISQDADEAMSLVRLTTGSATLISRLTRRSVDHLAIRPGDHLWAQIKSVAIVR